MAITFTQTDTVAPLGVIQACSPAAPAVDADAVEATVGGTAGSSELACDVASGSSELCLAVELAVSDDDSLDAGTLTMRINVTSAQMDLTWEEVYVCRVDSGGTSQETLGSVTGMGVDVSGGGVFNQNVTLSAASAHDAGDVVYITCVFANSHSMTSRSVNITPSEDVDTPFTSSTPNQGTGSAALPSLAASGSGVVNVSGTGSAPLPSLAASGAGGVVVSGTGSSAIPALSASGSGTVGSTTNQGTGSSPLPSLAASGSGELVVAGTGATPLPALSASGVAEADVAASGAGALPTISASGLGGVLILGSGGALIPLIDTAGSGAISIAATGSAALPAIGATGSTDGGTPATAQPSPGTTHLGHNVGLTLIC